MGEAVCAVAPCAGLYCGCPAGVVLGFVFTSPGPTRASRARGHSFSQVVTATQEVKLHAKELYISSASFTGADGKVCVGGCCGGYSSRTGSCTVGRA